jgi:hypothetical protein
MVKASVSPCRFRRAARIAACRLRSFTGYQGVGNLPRPSSASRLAAAGPRRSGPASRACSKDCSCGDASRRCQRTLKPWVSAKCGLETQPLKQPRLRPRRASASRWLVLQATRLQPPHRQRPTRQRACLQGTDGPVRSRTLERLAISGQIQTTEFPKP